MPYGLNDSGQIVGYYTLAGKDHPFVLLTGIDGDYTSFEVPGSSITRARDINNLGDIVGRFDDAFGTHGFLLSGGNFTTIDVPGSIETRAFGINDAGQIVGEYTDAAGMHGFLATPIGIPEPGTLLLTGAGLLALLAYKGVRVRQPHAARRVDRLTAGAAA
jgi:uncharacterized membrane protein